MKELELKLTVPAGQRAALLRSLGLSKAPKVNLEAHYFDTTDRLLEKSDMSLRVRKEGPVWIQTLKSATAHPASRFEDSVVITAGHGVPSPDLTKHSERKAGKALQKLLTGSDNVELHELYRTVVTRRFITCKLKADCVEIAFDEGGIQSNGHELAICELELELKSKSNASELFALARRLVKEHGLWLSTLSKSSRGAQLSVAPHSKPPAVKAKPVDFNPKASSGKQFRAMLDNCLAQIAPNASQVAAGSVDADQVHQLRVGIRRLRTVLKDASPLVHDVPSHWEPALRTAFQALGAYRDRVDVGETIKPKLEAAGAPLSVPATSDVGTQSLQDAVCSTDFQTVLLELLAYTLASADGTDISARAVLVKRMNALHEKVLKEGKRFTKLDTDSQHSVRKRMKRLRYISELSAPLFGEKRVEDFIAKLSPAQDALGDHNDGLVALEEFKASAKKDGRAWFGVGWLTANRAQTAFQCKQRLKELRKAEPFW
jgi:inorganic triphosphatase YgiF